MISWRELQARINELSEADIEQLLDDELRECQHQNKSDHQPARKNPFNNNGIRRQRQRDRHEKSDNV